MAAAARDQRRLASLSDHLASSSATATVTAGGAACDSGGGPRPKIAAVVTEYRRYSHAQHICDRFLIGYGWENHHHRPAVDLVALFVDQSGENDLSDSRCDEFLSLKKYGTIAEALCCGGDTLAVDGVLLIGEHGGYPKNELGMTLYPRYEFFQEIVAVFRSSGRTCPVFNDKHLSWSYDLAKEMVDTSKQLGFPLLAGSSLPVTARMPSIDVPYGMKLEEALCLGVGGPDGYDIHCLEALQCLVERRDGGETGVAWIESYRGEEVWERMHRGSFSAGGFSLELLTACMCRSLNLIPDAGSDEDYAGVNHRLPTLAELPGLVAANGKGAAIGPVCYRFQYVDGLCGTILLLNGVVGDMTCAVMPAAGAAPDVEQKPLSMLMYLRPRELCNFFSPLAWYAEQLFLSGEVAWPIERSLLTTGLTAAGITALASSPSGARLMTPELTSISYTAPTTSVFMGAAGVSNSNPQPLPPLGGGGGISGLTPSAAAATEGGGRKRLRVAVIGTIWTYSCHTDHIANRFLSGYPINGEWHMPEMDVVSGWIDQRGRVPIYGGQSSVKDLAAARAEEFGFELFESIESALCCGGTELAVDAVLMNAEHGDYPHNELGQKLYPRHEWFGEIARVLEASGRSIPVYSDKHLSYSFVEAEKMVATADRLGIALMADSSLPFSWRLPDIELPIGCKINEALMVASGGADPHGFHGMASFFAMLERRAGGEAGVVSVQAVTGPAVWALGKANGWSLRLLEAAISCSDEINFGVTLAEARPQDLVGNLEVLADLTRGSLDARQGTDDELEGPLAFIIEHADGLRSTQLMLNGAVGDFCFAASVEGPDGSPLGDEEGIVATTCLRSPGPNVHYSACLASNIEQMFATGTPPYDVRRTLLVGGVLEKGLLSLRRGGERLETPELAGESCRYAPKGPGSQHTRA